MSKLLRNTTFNLGFGIVLCLFAFLNYLVYVISYNDFIKGNGFSGGAYWAGFPAVFYHAIIGNPNSFHFSWLGLIVNILIAVFFSFAAGLFFGWFQKEQVTKRPFKSGFSVGIILILTLHLLNYLLILKIKYSGVPGICYFGFPFKIYLFNGYSSNWGEFYWMGLIANIISTVVFSFAMGIIFTFGKSKLRTRGLNLK
jgi:hypothetical protein